MTRFSPAFLRFGLLMCVLITGMSISMQARLPQGVEVKERTASTVSFSYIPMVKRWDTVVAHDGKTIRPVIDGAQVRTSVDGSIVQWVITLDCIVPGPDRFRVDRSDFRTLSLASSLPFTVEKSGTGARALTERPQNERIAVAYDGIAGDRHIARVTIVVASRQNGQTTITRSADVRLTLIGASTPASTSTSTLDVLNPKAPWTTKPTVRFAKGERVQGADVFENMFKVSIDREGVYRLTADQLRAAGVPTDALAAASIRVFGRGGLELPEQVDSAAMSTLREQPIIVRTNGDGSVRDVIFYASATTGWARDGSVTEHYIHHYAKTSNYYLTYGGQDGLRASQRSASPMQASIQPSIVTGRVFNEDELVSPYSEGSGRRWFGRSIENGGSIIINSILPGLVRSGTVEYRYVVAHRGTVAGSSTITENGTFVAQSNIKSVPKYMDAYSTFGSGKIDALTLPADARSVLRFAYSCPDKAANGMLDWFEIHYPRQLQAADGEFEFWTVNGLGVHEYAVNGFSGDVFGFDITDRTRPQLIENVSNTGGVFVSRESIETAPARCYFFASNLRPASLVRVTFPNLRSRPRGGDLLVITSSSLQPSAQRYADYRTSKGRVKATVITTDEIFAEFSYGMPDPTAIRDFIAMAYSTWTPQPHSILIWGDGHFDYKNISSTEPNHVIPYESLDPDDQDYGLVTYTTDDFFVRVAGRDTRPELALGRIPVTTNALGDRITGKIRVYE
ncbi:MAG: C25 family cysteine peptidase, partial [Candidatus Kapabacteria bacterium]|nr:C25 family cysteine peptidase [Candidatus Kapabacteria bacterium]